MLGAVRFYPHCLGVFDGFDKFHSFFERKVETGGGNRIRNSGIRGKDGNRCEGIFREKGLRVDDMVISLSIHPVDPLIITAGDHRAAHSMEGIQVFIAAFRVLDADDPGISLGILGSGHTHIAPQADDILAQLKDGADWDTLMAEKTDDPGMQEGAPTAATGYAVSEGFTAMDEAFVNAAMALKNVGDVSPKTRGMYGYYIIQYTSDVPEGPVPLEELRDIITEAELSAKKQAAYEEALGLWVAEADAKVNYDALK